MTPRSVLLLEDDGQVASSLSLLEEVLLQLQAFDDDDEPAAPDLGPVELEALQRVSGAVRRAGREQSADFFGAGDFNFGKVRSAALATEDLASVGRAIAALGRSLLPGGDSYAREALDTSAQASMRRRSGHELVTELAQAHGMLDLVPDADVEALVPLTLRGGVVHLEATQEAAYRRYVERVLAMKLNDPLERFTHLG